MSDDATDDGSEPLPKTAKVIVTNVDISFGNMVGLLVKLAFAAIPALLIVGLVIAVIVAILAPTVQLPTR